MADNNNIPGLSTTTDPVSQTGGLINNAPTTNANPATTTPAVAPTIQQTTPATATAYTPQSYQVTPDQTVSGQIKNIIASGSPLMRQAETNAKNVMNQRGLINSSTGITAGQSAVLSAATPIATADAGTYNKAASDTITAQNAAMAAGAQAQNTASIQNAQADASKAIAQLQSGTTLAAQGSQNQSQQAIAKLQADTAYQTTMANIASAKDLQGMQGDVQTAIAKLQSDTTLSAQDKQSATAQIIAQIQSNTTLTAQDKASAAQMALAAVNNASAQQIADIQANTALSIQEKQALSAQVIAGMNNANALAVQKLVNEGNLATIKANGDINLKVTELTNTNKLLLQSSAAASSVYTQVLSNMAAIMTNPNLAEDQKATALNNLVAGLNDALGAIGAIANNTNVGSTLNFTGGQGGGYTTNPDGTITQTTPTSPVTGTQQTGGGAAQKPLVTPPAPTPQQPAYSPEYTQSVMARYDEVKNASGLSDNEFLASPAAQPFVAARNTIIANTTDAATLMNDLAAARAQAADPVTKAVGDEYVRVVTEQMSKIGVPVI